MSKTFACLPILLLGSALATAAVTAGEPTTGRDGSKSASRLVCTAEPLVGSHIKRKICVSEEEHERRLKEDQAAMQKMRTVGGGAKTGPPKMPN